jgi:hypothetical protein
MEQHAYQHRLKIPRPLYVGIQKKDQTSIVHMSTTIHANDYMRSGSLYYINWPNEGEIDIIEGVNDGAHNAMMETWKACTNNIDISCVLTYH